MPAETDAVISFKNSNNKLQSSFKPVSTVIRRMDYEEHTGTNRVFPSAHVKGCIPRNSRVALVLPLGPHLFPGMHDATEPLLGGDGSLPIPQCSGI